MVAAMMGLNILKILRFVKEEFLIVLGTCGIGVQRIAMAAQRADGDSVIV